MLFAPAPAPSSSRVSRGGSYPTLQRPPRNTRLCPSMPIIHTHPLWPLISRYAVLLKYGVSELLPLVQPTVQQCSSPECTNVVGAQDSLGPRRCSACILSDWKSKKARAADAATSRRHRTVSWAPTLVAGLKQAEDLEIDAAAVKGPGEATPEPQPTSPATPIDGEDKLSAPMDTSPETAGVGKPTLKIKLNFSNARTKMTTVSGWDSDLSDLSDSEMGDGSDAGESSGSDTVRGESDSEEEVRSPNLLLTLERMTP
jgi:hypothetical protein